MSPPEFPKPDLDEVMAKVTWTCHVCGTERPDFRIDVHVKDATRFNDDKGRYPVRMNIRYCNDNPHCTRNAPLVDFFDPYRGLEHTLYEDER
jgi:hypothetical protein